MFLRSSTGKDAETRNSTGKLKQKLINDCMPTITHTQLTFLHAYQESQNATDAAHTHTHTHMEHALTNAL